MAFRSSSTSFTFNASRLALTCLRGDVQIEIERETGNMVKALRRWLEANELLAIVTGVIGALVALSLLLVLGGYLLVTR